MLSLVFIIIFIFCLAIAGASILLGHRMITTYNSVFHKNYFYFLVSFFAFAIYAIWGNIIVRTILTELNTRPEVIEAMAHFASLSGLPFIFISWIMLINMAHSLFDKSIAAQWAYYHLGLLAILILGIWFGYRYFSLGGNLSNNNIRLVLMAFLAIFGLINYIVFITLVKTFARKTHVRGIKTIQTFAVLLTAAFLLQITVMAFVFHSTIVMGAMIFLFFALNTIPVLYMRWNSDDIFNPVRAENSSESSIAALAKKYGISPRENEIINHICLGKTNRQIADELCISLQTVKDHTHRIYSKIGINSRMQLVQLVNN
jgi:DNA-binding CsgD family transcriptional regulator